MHYNLDTITKCTIHAQKSHIKSANKPSTSCVRTACPKLSTSLKQAVNNLFNNLVDIIRLVARLFQQVQYSHDITTLLQPCFVKLVTFLLHHDSIKLVRTTL
jgi:ArsR family metal-binding transcriptional regulator